MKRLITFFRLDANLSLKDSITIYSLVSPIILAILFAILLPGVQDLRIDLAVQQSGIPDQRILQRLGEYGSLEVLPDRSAVIARVQEYDDMAGITWNADGSPEIILEGNESAVDAELIAALLRAAADDAPGFSASSRNLGGEGAPITEYITVMMVMLGLLIGGLLIGFNIVEEKESGVIRALATSPLRIGEYIAARSIFALIIGVVSGFLSLVILMGFTVNLGLFFLAVGLSLLVALPFGFIIGSFADNQMTAFAMVKLLMMVFMSIPLVSIFVPAGFQWLFYILPNYWMFVLLSNVIVGEAWTHSGLLFSAVATLVSGLAFIALLIPAMKKRLKLR
jgi:ABC-2 type transport system permease protein